MLINRKSLLCILIFQTIISISYESPTDIGNENHEEVDESDIEKVITKKKDEEENMKEEKLDQNKKQETGNNKTDDDSSSQKIKQLEKEKGELYKQIKKAIDESVILLELTNDTEAKIGISFMKDLKDQLKEINGTDLKLDNKEESVQRRSRVGDTRMHSKNKVSINYEEISDLFKKKSSNYSKNGQYENDIQVKKKIDDWILQRQVEKKKILGYKGKQNRGKQEKCPRLGFGKKKIKVNGEKRSQYRPCCRKCCKKSYMGCL